MVRSRDGEHNIAYGPDSNLIDSLSDHDRERQDGMMA